MPKRFPTADPDIFTYADGTHYVRIGDRERSLRTKDFKTAVKNKKAVLAKIDATGDASARLRCGDVWFDYETVRKTQKEMINIDDAWTKSRRRRKTISPGTFKEIQDLWRLHLGPFWQTVRFDKVDEEKWMEYVDQCDVIDLANHRKVWSGFLKWCKTKKYVKYVPDMPIPSVERRERRVLKPNEIKKMFEFAQGNVLLFISMYLFMGMRRKEIMTLMWKDIHMEERYLTLRKSEVKTRQGRPLPINSFVLDLLSERQFFQKKAKINTPYVFPNQKSAKRHADVSGLKTAWQTVITRCKFQSGYVTPHDLRATFEAYAHKATAFTDTQREKFAGAAIDVQKKTYVRFDAEDIRGLEAVVKIEGLESILENKLGKTRGDENDLSIH